LWHSWCSIDCGTDGAVLAQVVGMKVNEIQGSGINSLKWFVKIYDNMQITYV
jgi:hypothetical protein